MAGRHSRNKGANWERELARILQPLWPGAKRGIGQARSAKEVSDVEGTPFWVEAKHQQRCSIPAAYQQAVEATDGRPVLVVTKDNGQRPLVTMELDAWLRWMTLACRPSSGSTSE